MRPRTATRTDEMSDRDVWPSRPESRGQWLTRLDVVTGWDGPDAARNYVIHTWSIGGLRVASVGEGMIRAANGWEARWSPDGGQCGGGEWLGIDPTPEEG